MARKCKPIRPTSQVWSKRFVPNENGTPFAVRMEDIKATHTAKELRRFNSWLFGQTCPVLEDGSGGVYVWDYFRWLDGGCPSAQGVDWD